MWDLDEVDFEFNVFGLHLELTNLGLESLVTFGTGGLHGNGDSGNTAVTAGKPR